VNKGLVPGIATEGRHLLRARPAPHGADPRNPMAHRRSQQRVVASRKDAAIATPPPRDDPQFRVIKGVLLSLADDVVADARVVSNKSRPIAEEPHLVVIVNIEA